MQILGTIMQTNFPAAVYSLPWHKLGTINAFQRCETSLKLIVIIQRGLPRMVIKMPTTNRRGLLYILPPSFPPSLPHLSLSPILSVSLSLPFFKYEVSTYLNTNTFTDIDVDVLKIHRQTCTCTYSRVFCPPLSTPTREVISLVEVQKPFDDRKTQLVGWDREITLQSQYRTMLGVRWGSFFSFLAQQKNRIGAPGI